jgi:hypothetical protein
MSLAPERLEVVTAAFRNGAQSYARIGSPLYSALCAGGESDPEVVALAAHAMAGSQPVFHLLASVHHLLMGDPSDPLARFFATLTDDPLPPEEAWPDFARYCREHRDELLDLLANNTVQTTYAERCVNLVAPMAYVADRAGEPLHLIEIGCSAGVLLAFDKYAYEYEGRGRIGATDAPLTLLGRITGDAPLRIPRIASRTGLDIHPVDARSEAERRWLIALTFPEFVEERARLAAALETVAATDIRIVAGNALETLPGALAATPPGPLCIFHSACLYYWDAASKAALDTLLTEASRTREIYRVGLEASEAFNAWHKGRSGAVPTGEKPPHSGEITVAHYRVGRMDSRVVAHNSVNGPVEWLEEREAALSRMPIA